MAVENKTFEDLIDFNRGGGATRVNAAGLIVGVDFSVTSNTIATGPQTFTLDADANVNRDWSIGENVIAVAQNGVGDMVGTITSYDPATQVLVIEVATITGSGTTADWRIGSLEYRRDANGLVREPEATNLCFNTEDLTSVFTSLIDLDQTPNAGLDGSGSTKAVKYVAKTIDNFHLFRNAGFANASTSVYCEMLVEPVGYTQFQLAILNANSYRFSVMFDLTGEGSVIAEFANVAGEQILSTNIERRGTKYVVSVEAAATVVLNRVYCTPNPAGTTPNNTAVKYLGDGVSGCIVSDFIFSDKKTSFIPTKGVAVTRPADNFPLTQDAISRIRQGQGTLVIEAETDDNGLSQKSALTLTGDTGEIRVAKEGILSGSNLRGLSEGDGRILIANDNSFGVENDGLNFNSVDSGGTANDWVSTAYKGNGEFGFVNSVLSGVDNAEWLYGTEVKQLGAGSIRFNSAHWTGSQFIVPIALAGLVALSNGDSYRVINDPNITQPCNDATHDPVTGRIVIVGNNGFTAYSDDNGESWVAGGDTIATNFGAARTNVHFVVVGASSSIRYSTDGISYTVASGQAGVFNAIHWNGTDTLVSVGNSGVIYYSLDDGVTWTPATSNTTVTLRAVTYSPEENLWVASGDGGTVLTATDPTGSWAVFNNTTTPATGTSSTFNGVTYRNGLFYFSTGNTNAVLVFDPVAVTFTLQAGIGQNGVFSTLFTKVENSPNGLFIVGTNGAIGFASTANPVATDWVSLSNNNSPLNGIAYGNNRFVSVGNVANGQSYIATIDHDGTVTRKNLAQTGGNASGVNFVNGVFVVGNQLGLHYSLDNGETFIFNEVGGSDDIVQTIYTGSLYVCVVGNNGAVIQYSPTIDGVFTQVSNIGGLFIALTDIAFKNGLIVVVGSNGSILTATDPTLAENWTLQNSGTTNTLRSVIFSERDQLWYAAGDNGTLLFSPPSADNWQPVQDSSLSAIQKSTLQASLRNSSWQVGTNRIALSYGLNNVEMSINGSPKVTDTTASIPTITGGAVGATFNGRIKKIEYRPTQSDVEAI